MNDVPLAELLDSLNTSQLGDLGEEIARAWLEDVHDAVIVTMGDSRLTREGRLQDLDMTVLLDGEFAAIEVKTTYSSVHAGRLTRTGNLHRPRLRHPRKAGERTPRQGSPGYAARRLSRILDHPDDGLAPTLVVAVDLRGMLIQLFPTDDAGKLLDPHSAPDDCRPYVDEAVATLRRFGRYR